jgi:hypothetical protein
MLHHIENHIENMRQKPEHIKRQYALGVSLGITLVIFGVWASSKSFSLNPEAAAMAKKASPVKTLTASAGDAFDYVKSYFVGGNKVKYEDPIEVVPGKI